MDNQFSSSYNGHTTSSYSKPTSSTSTGLKLVLPSLKSVLAAKSSKKSKPRPSYAQSPIAPSAVDIIEKRPPRPAKLKPLKEVLSKLIAQIKKKDDYAFFLNPVDIKNVPGYSDVVKTPMDFGTMTEKVNRGKYRSLEEFADDFRLVTTNAKIFNPPGTIYHTEAEKIEIWGVEHINKAAGTVIQFEADWNIDIEGENDAPNVNVDEEEQEDRSEPEEQARARSASVVSQQPARRGPRGPYKKQNQPSTLSESLDPDGRMPGSKDGLGAFPSCSDWSRTMLHLKLKGKRYKTKKERMKIEKEGPPTHADGSLDYPEMEDPFSVLSVLVPDPPTRPALIPLYPPITSQEPAQHPVPPFPPASSVCWDHRPSDANSYPDLTSSQPTRRRHWNVSRSVNVRQKLKDKDDDEAFEGPPWKEPRQAHSTDFGSFALLAGELSEEMRRRGIAPIVIEPGQEHQIHHDLIRDSLAIEPSPASQAKVVDAALPQEQEDLVKNYWTSERILDGEVYLHDMVYGGDAGLAYVRSLAEFMDYRSEDVEEDSDEEFAPPYARLGVPLVHWVETSIVDPLTDGRHSLLRQSAFAIEAPTANVDGAVKEQVAKSLYVHPVANAALAALRSINLHKIDMGALIKTPAELFVSEEEWYGKELKERRKRRRLEAPQADSAAQGPAGDAMEVEEPAQSWVSTVNAQPDAEGELEGPEELKEVLEYSAAVIIDLNKRNELKEVDVKSEGTVAAEDPVLRNIRLNLLALAKRAPLDTIARLPKDLVPEHIRQYVPTLGSST